MSSFADTLLNKGNTVSVNVGHNCDRCNKCSKKYFIHMNKDGKDTYICSYLCSKDLHLDYGRDYWDTVVNLEDFNHLRPIVEVKKEKEKFSIEYNELDHERNEFIQSLIDEDKRIEELEREYELSSSDSENEYY
jgi:hypothetical protein